LPTAMGALAIDPRNTQTVYAAGLNPRTGLYKSTDAGLHWVNTHLDTTTISSIVVDPTNSAVVYVAGIDDAFRSDDSGSTWQALNTHATPSEIVVDPKEPRDLLVMGLFADPADPSKALSGVVRSVDAGTTWERIPLAEYHIPTLLYHGILDPLLPQHVIAA